MATIAKGRAGPDILNVRVIQSGGDKLRRVLLRSRGVKGVDLARIAAPVFQRIILPQLRSAVPYKTGRLANSFSITARGEAVEIRAVFYAGLAKFNAGQTTVADLVDQIFNANRERIISEISAGVRRHLGV